MKNMRRLSLLLSVLLTVLCILPSSVLADETSEDQTSDDPGIVSGNVVVAYSMDDGQFLYTDRLDEKVEPTVAVKLMTCMVVADILSERKLSSESVEVTVSDTAITIVGNYKGDVRYPSMGLSSGEVYTAKDLISATLVVGANDAAASLAVFFGEKYLGGTVIDFISRMNAKAKEIGLENTHFDNPTGLPSPNQYSTPRDIAFLAAAFYKYNGLVSLSDVESFTFNKKTTRYSNNYLKCAYYIKGYINKNAIGLIGGQLDKNGNYCLITAAQKDGRTYIFVVMCASGIIVDYVYDDNNNITGTVRSLGIGNAYDDMNKLIAWVRDSFRLVTIATTSTIIGELRVELGDSSDHVMVIPAEDVERLVINKSGGKLESVLEYDESLVYKKEYNGSVYDTVRAPVLHGDVVGKITYYYNGQEIASVDAVIKDSVETDSVKEFFSDIEGVLFGNVMKVILYIIGGLIALYIIIALVLFIIRTVNKAKGKNKSKKPEKSRKNNKKGMSSAEQNAATREMR